MFVNQESYELRDFLWCYTITTKKYEIEIHDHDLVHDNTAIKIWKTAEILSASQILMTL